MECLIEQGRERAKWTVICGVLFHLRILSVLSTSFSLGGLIYCTAPTAYSPTVSLSISHTEMLVAYMLSLTCWHVKTNMHIHEEGLCYGMSSVGVFLYISISLIFRFKPEVHDASKSDFQLRVYIRSIKETTACFKKLNCILCTCDV